MNWHTDALPKETLNALSVIATQEWLETPEWYLAGGTALALQVGHRKSVDLDFFSIQSTFNPAPVIGRMSPLGFETTSIEEGTIYGILKGASISFIAYPFFKRKYDYLQYEKVNVLDKRDIAVMKVTAISQRGAKRDFFDLYWYAQNEESLRDVLTRLPNQYPSAQHDYQHILKSLVYFADAEGDPMPEMSIPVEWEEVKRFFISEVPKITKILLRLE